jgi:hypothetical protein
MEKVKEEHIKFVDKPREEQEKDFKEFIAPYANPSCPLCLGRGFSGWHVQLNQLIPCTCAVKNIIKAKKEKQVETKPS